MKRDVFLTKLPRVTVLRGGNELKIYQGNTVYLNGGESFELKFFNPTDVKVAASIEFNGRPSSNSRIVINPGQTVTIDRYLDVNRKMKFDTYLINGEDSDAVAATSLNGMIMVNFYKELEFVTYRTTTNTTYVSPTFGPIFGESPSHFFDPNIYQTTGNTSGNVFYSSITATADCKSLETGRIGKGDVSDQILGYDNSTYDTNSFCTVTLQVKPVSVNHDNSEVRNYCSSCGYRIRKNTWKYCPKCGRALD